MTKITYDDLVGLMNAELDCGNGLGAEVSYLLDAARVNADDTMREGTDQTWEAIAIATLEEQLCYHKDEVVKAWFVGHGIKF